MENILIIVGITFSVGLLLGWILTKIQTNSKHNHIKEQLISVQKDFEFLQTKYSEQTINYQNTKEAYILANEKLLNKKEEIIEMIRAEKDEYLLAYEKAKIQNQFLVQELEMNQQNLENIQNKFTQEFENLATKILEEKSKKFTLQNQENIHQILQPLQEKIQLFENKVENTHKESIDYHAALRQQIVGLKELNEQMNKETINLTKALKGDVKTQGNWGELILEKVLEKSGLEKGREYFVQQSFVNDYGNRVQPDVIIHLPDQKKMIIDSKVSLTAYEKYINEDFEPTKTNHLKAHLDSIKRHITQLSDKNYHDLHQIECPDFVLLFIPIESAFAIALNEDVHLYTKAFEKNIIIVTPTTLLATLRTIDSMWTNQKQQNNAMEIAKQAGALYDKFVGFIGDMTEIGKKLQNTQVDYQNAINKLSTGKGNLITSVEKLKKMGAKAKKSLSETSITQINQNNLQY